jgi:hypothetical protein
MKWSIALLSAIFATACSSVKVREQSGFAIESGQTFAWAADSGLEDVTGLPIGGYLEAVTRELAERGVHRARGAAPDLVVDVDVQVETRVRQNDPVVELFVSEEYEQATMGVSAGRATCAIDFGTHAAPRAASRPSGTRSTQSESGTWTARWRGSSLAWRSAEGQRSVT